MWAGPMVLAGLLVCGLFGKARADCVLVQVIIAALAFLQLGHVLETLDLVTLCEAPHDVVCKANQDELHVCNTVLMLGGNFVCE
jgi:hypothetical protein